MNLLGALFPVEPDVNSLETSVFVASTYIHMQVRGSDALRSCDKIIQWLIRCDALFLLETQGLVANSLAR